MAALRAFMVSALSRLNRWMSFVDISKDLGMYTFQYRTEGEEGYVA